MLADVTRVGFKNFSTGYWAFADRLFSCEINFCGRFFRFSFLLRLRVAFLEFKPDIFLVGQYEKRFEWSALAGDEPFEQIGSAARKQFVHLFSLDRSLQDDFARAEVAR